MRVAKLYRPNTDRASAKRANDKRPHLRRFAKSVVKYPTRQVCNVHCTRNGLKNLQKIRLIRNGKKRSILRPTAANQGREKNYTRPYCIFANSSVTSIIHGGKCGTEKQTLKFFFSTNVPTSINYRRCAYRRYAATSSIHRLTTPPFTI